MSPGNNLEQNLEFLCTEKEVSFSLLDTENLCAVISLNDSFMQSIIY